MRSGFIVRENIGDLQFDKYAKALELIISLATGKGGGEPAAPTQIDAGELEEWASELSDFLYRIAQWGNQDGHEAECLGQGLPALRAHLAKSKGGV